MHDRVVVLLLALEPFIQCLVFLSFLLQKKSVAVTIHREERKGKREGCSSWSRRRVQGGVLGWVRDGELNFFVIQFQSRKSSSGKKIGAKHGGGGGEEAEREKAHDDAVI